MATGSEVSDGRKGVDFSDFRAKVSRISSLVSALVSTWCMTLAARAYDMLKAEGCAVRLVSVPCVELFKQQSA
eukprot:8211695-Pyramimonas_sp.AAC.1